jgi:hypothetical protein
MTWTTQLRSTTMWTSGSPRVGVMIEIESLSLDFKFRIRNNSLGVI